MPGSKVIAIDIGSHPVKEQAQQAAEILARHDCRTLVTTNEWGMDTGGTLWAYCDTHKILHLNWCVDDPFFEETILTNKYRPSKFRFDFVSDKGYVGPMREQGYNAFFLPLAVDPAWFHPDAMENAGTEKRWDDDIIFVGNSSLAQMDDLLKIAPGFVDTLAPFLGAVVERYLENVEYDVEGHIAKKIRSLRHLPAGLTYKKALFIAKHAAGYFGRKRTVLSLVKKYPGFKVFGDEGWAQDLPPERLGYAKYYTNLCETYRKAKIVIDMNRMVIRNGFTQRVFDVPASGGFVITSSKPLITDFFKTSGPEQDIVVFTKTQELTTLIDYYLVHEDERLAIAERGRRNVLGAHTYDHRIREMFSVVSGQLALLERPATSTRP